MLELALLNSVDFRKKVDVLRDRKFNEDRNKELLKCKKKYIRALQSEKKYTDAVSESVEYFNNHPDDIDGLKLVRLTLSKNRRYDLLESIERKNDKNQRSFWSRIALLNVLLKRVQDENKKNFSEIEDIIKTTSLMANFSNEKFEIFYRACRFKIFSKAMDVESTLLDFGESLLGLRNPYRIDRFTRLCVEYFNSLDQLDNSLVALDLILFQNNDIPYQENRILDLLNRIGKFRFVSSPNQNIELKTLKEKILNS